MKLLKHNLTTVVLVSVLAISVFMLLFAASISYRQIQTLRKTQRSVVHSYKIYAELEQLNSYAADAETGQRGFILTRDSIFLQPYYEALEKVKWSFARLSMLTSDDYKQSRGLDSLVFLVNQRFRFLDHVLADPASQVEASDSLSRLLLRGRDMMVLTLGQIDRMVFNELQFLRSRETEYENSSKFSPYGILFIVIFSVFIFILSFYKINRDLKLLEKTNNQLIINSKIFEHTEQIADISHWYWDIKESKLMYSVNLYHLLGCREKEFEPTFENFLQYVHPADRNILIDGRQKVVSGYSPPMSNFRVIRKDGEVRHFKSSGRLITDSYGARFSIGIDADITEQYRKDRILKEKLSDLERSNKQLSAFSHIASHDLQEPLRKVQTFISRIRESDLVSLPDAVKDYLSGIKKETVRMQKFINDLLLYSRASKTDKTFETADLNEILEASKRELSHRIEEKNAIINSASDLPVLKVIPFQMQQLFSNLISNSIKYSKDNVVPIIDISNEILMAKDMPVHGADADCRYYRITFTDNGIGFDPQYSEKIFTLFYRLHNNREYTGTGIGLSICKIIVENHKGIIIAEGKPDKGSSFHIFLPAGKA